MHGRFKRASQTAQTQTQRVVTIENCCDGRWRHAFELSIRPHVLKTCIVHVPPPAPPVPRTHAPRTHALTSNVPSPRTSSSPHTAPTSPLAATHTCGDTVHQILKAREAVKTHTRMSSGQLMTTVLSPPSPASPPGPVGSRRSPRQPCCVPTVPAAVSAAVCRQCRQL